MAAIEKIKVVLEEIYRHQERWNQDWWSEFSSEELEEDPDADPKCDTTMCFAGWTVLVFDPEAYQSAWEWNRHIGKWQATANFTFAKKAAEILELDAAQQDWMFSDPTKELREYIEGLNELFGDDIFSMPTIER